MGGGETVAVGRAVRGEAEGVAAGVCEPVAVRGGDDVAVVAVVGTIVVGAIDAVGTIVGEDGVVGAIRTIGAVSGGGVGRVAVVINRHVGRVDVEAVDVGAVASTDAPRVHPPPTPTSNSRNPIRRVGVVKRSTDRAVSVARAGAAPAPPPRCPSVRLRLEPTVGHGDVPRNLRERCRLEKDGPGRRMVALGLGREGDGVLFGCLGARDFVEQLARVPTKARVES